MKPTEDVLEKFNLKGEVEFLPGGEGRTYRVGDIILKHINTDSVESTNWTADLFSKVKENNFRVSNPFKNNNNEWVTSDGWSAWEFLEGNHNYKDHIEQSIESIIAFHEAIKDFPKPVFLDKDSPYTRADIYAWGKKPEKIHPDLKEFVELLYKVRQPVNGLEDQIIHGDLNPDNILVSETFSPAIIDIAPYWRPAEFALAIYAYWIAAWRDERSLFHYFENIKEFDQMLVRAGIRMLLIMSEFNRVHDLDKYKKATEIIIERFK